jgi:hypothetical protein
MFARLRSFANPPSWPLRVIAIVLVAYLFADIDDLDSELYARIAQNVATSGNLWHLSWTPNVLSDFHDHLPPLFWLLALLQRLLGSLGTRIAFGCMVLGTWIAFHKLATRAGMEGPARKGLWLVPLTEAYFSAQTWPRLDQPYLLLFILALLWASDGRGWRVVASALCVGGAMLLRPPMALSLFLLVPASALAHRSWQPGRLVERADGPRLLLFVFSALLPPLSLHLADLAWGPGDTWAQYLHNQVLTSLTGARQDGAPSHLAPLRFLTTRFWPGFPFAALGLALFFRQRALRNSRFLWLCALWVAAIIGGLSLGKRHVGHHIWSAYPPLFLFAGLGLSQLSNWLRLGPAREQRAATAMAATCGTLALFLPRIYKPSEPFLAARAISRQEERICPTIKITTPSLAWRLTIPIAHHFQSDVAFVSMDEVQSRRDCLQVAAAAPRAEVPTNWRLLHRSGQVSFFAVK